MSTSTSALWISSTLVHAPTSKRFKPFKLGKSKLYLMNWLVTVPSTSPFTWGSKSDSGTANFDVKNGPKWNKLEGEKATCFQDTMDIPYLINSLQDSVKMLCQIFIVESFPSAFQLPWHEHPSWFHQILTARDTMRQNRWRESNHQRWSWQSRSRSVWTTGHSSTNFARTCAVVGPQ